MERGYFSRRVTDTDNSWKSLVIRDNIRRAFSTIAIVNDDETQEIQVKFNNMQNDALYIGAGETISMVEEVGTVFYYAESGNPTFRVIAD